MLWGSGAIFLRLLGSHREKNKSMKQFVRFSTTDVFVSVSQLSTRDLFYFLENLKIKQDVLSWVSRLVRSLDQRALWFPYSRLFFGIVFKKMFNSWVFGVFYKVNCGVDLGFLTHLFQKDVLNLLTCKRNHNSEFFGHHWGAMLIESSITWTNWNR